MEKYFILLIIIILSLVFTGCVGEAMRSNLQLKQPILKREPLKIEQREIKAPDGCYLKSNNEYIYLTNSESECDDLFLAVKFNDKIDFNRLLTDLGYKIDERKILGLTTEEIDIGVDLNIYYKKGNNYLDPKIKKKIISGKCEDIEFFGIKLFCFNTIVKDNFIEKENNLIYVVPYVTILKYTSNIKHKNALANENGLTSAHEFVKDSGTLFYDGVASEFYNEPLANCCENPNHAACYSNKKSILCKSMLEKRNRMKVLNSVAIIYHEVVHELQGGHICWHSEDFDYNMKEMISNNIEIESNCECNEQVPSGLKGTRDFDKKSVYGAHINYLFSMANNNILSCEERQFAYEQAIVEMKTKLCQKPDAPRIPFEFEECKSPIKKLIPGPIQPITIEVYS